MPSLRKASPSVSPTGAGSRASTRAPASTSTASSEPPYDLRQLDAGRSTAEHDEPSRYGLHRGRLTRAPHALELAQARDRWDHGIRAGSYDDVLGGVANAVDVDDAWPREPAAAAQELNSLARQPALLSGVGIVRDHEVTPGKRGFDVNLREPYGFTCAMYRLARAQQRLGRNARPIGALTADQVALDERDAQLALGQCRGAVLSGRATTKDDDVVVTAHGAVVHLGLHRIGYGHQLPTSSTQP